jgi:phenylpropionate dioxygenase-like ring-hydroxylating dioxygenase large terminal subunit
MGTSAMPDACSSAADDRAVPSFEHARTRRQMTRAAGLDPNHWYAVAHAERLRPGKLLETRFLDRPIVVFRGADGVLGAIENRCAHRQVKLSLGEVKGCTLVCAYHGWAYDASGQLATIPHETYGRSIARIRVGSFPVRERYGLVWVFPGEPSLADTTPMPEIPELEGPTPWAHIAVDFTWAAHHSLIIENVSDFSHAHLHRKYRPFSDAKLTDLDTAGSRVLLSYDVLVGDGRLSKHFVDRSRVKVDRMDLCFDYPYQWSDTGGRIKHWCFLLPLDRRTTHVFFVFYFDAVQIPLLRRPMPRSLQQLLMAAARRLLIKPLLAQDGRMVEAEQLAYEWDCRIAGYELNPAVGEFQKMIVGRWRDHLVRSRQVAPVDVATPADVAAPADVASEPA